MESGNYQKALNILSLALNQPRSIPIAGFLLADRADCLWELGNVHAAVQEMMTAIHAGLSSDEANSEVTSVLVRVLFFSCVLLKCGFNSARAPYDLLNHNIIQSDPGLRAPANYRYFVRTDRIIYPWDGEIDTLIFSKFDPMRHSTDTRSTTLVLPNQQILRESQPR